MLIGGISSLVTGSSGTIMMMAGLEKKFLNIQIWRSIFIIILSLILIPIYGMISVVSLYVFFMLFTNIIQLIYIKKAINISPFSFDLLKLIILTVFIMYIVMNQQYEFKITHFIIIPLGIYLVYFLLLIKPIKAIIQQLK
tara:strand:- start:323 stop:742 length:420 start_codon:yes stop_codon:yes gene_type:complete